MGRLQTMYGFVLGLHGQLLSVSYPRLTAGSRADHVAKNNWPTKPRNLANLGSPSALKDLKMLSYLWQRMLLHWTKRCIQWIVTAATSNSARGPIWKKKYIDHTNQETELHKHDKLNSVARFFKQLEYMKYLTCKGTTVQISRLDA